MRTRNPRRIIHIVRAVEQWWIDHPEMKDLSELCSELGIGFYTEDDETYRLLTGDPLPVTLFVEGDELGDSIIATIKTLNKTIFNYSERQEEIQSDPMRYVFDSVDALWFTWIHHGDIRLGQFLNNVVAGAYEGITPELVGNPSALIVAAREYHNKAVINNPDIMFC